ncbi:phage tail protein, partial [Xenorhabdus bovienii]|uniref:phage tail protein n=1 Tax=Xenorhabdus bovienii TaxID=40576 RepID=UPI000570F206
MKNPNLIPAPFAQKGDRDEIPASHKSGLPSQKATWDTGFPQITMMPVTAGGLPPSGRDFNGVFNQISDNIVHLSKGGKYKFSQEYANSINGYPEGAILQSDDETKEFQSLIDNNKINFNTESADKINSAWKLVSTNQILDELNKKLNRSDVVQSIGSSQSTVMSQRAVTDELNNIKTPASITQQGIVQLNNAVDSNNETQAATPKAVKVANDLANTAIQNAADANNNANSRLEKKQNGADIPDTKRFVENLGLTATVERAENAYPKTGGLVSGNVDATGHVSGNGLFE